MVIGLLRRRDAGSHPGKRWHGGVTPGSLSPCRWLDRARSSSSCEQQMQGPWGEARPVQLPELELDLNFPGAHHTEGQGVSRVLAGGQCPMGELAASGGPPEKRL